MVNAIGNSTLTSTQIGTVKSMIAKEGGVVEVTMVSIGIPSKSSF